MEGAVNKCKKYPYYLHFVAFLSHFAKNYRENKGMLTKETVLSIFFLGFLEFFLIPLGRLIKNDYFCTLLNTAKP